MSVQVQVSKGGAEGSDSKPSASASDMVSSLMSLKASPTLVAAFLRTQPGTSPHAQPAVSEAQVIHVFLVGEKAPAIKIVNAHS